MGCRASLAGRGAGGGARPCGPGLGAVPPPTVSPATRVGGGKGEGGGRGEDAGGRRGGEGEPATGGAVQGPGRCPASLEQVLWHREGRRALARGLGQGQEEEGKQEEEKEEEEEAAENFLPHCFDLFLALFALGNLTFFLSFFLVFGIWVLPDESWDYWIIGR